MGFADYLKPATIPARGNAGKKQGETSSSPMVQLPRPIYQSSVASSSRVTLDEDQRENIKHQVILSFLYEKQQRHRWIAEDSGVSEGVMVRKNRHEYLCRPPALANSPLAMAMAMLNVQVWSFPVRQASNELMT
jgi:hypothetical protein